MDKPFLDKQYFSIDATLLNRKRHNSCLTDSQIDVLFQRTAECFRHDFGFEIVDGNLVNSSISYNMRGLLTTALETCPVPSICKAAMELDTYFAQLEGKCCSRRRLDHVLLAVAIEQLEISDQEKQLILRAKQDVERFCSTGYAYDIFRDTNLDINDYCNHLSPIGNYALFLTLLRTNDFACLGWLNPERSMSIIDMQDLEFLIPETLDDWQAYVGVWSLQNAFFHPNAKVIKYAVSFVARMKPSARDLAIECINGIVVFIQNRIAHHNFDDFVNALDVLSTHTNELTFSIDKDLELSCFVALRTLMSLSVKLDAGLAGYLSTLKRFYKRHNKKRELTELDQSFSDWLLANKHLVTCPVTMEPDLVFKRLFKTATIINGSS